jgi:hypothetical protein
VLGLHPDHGLVTSFHTIRLLLSTEYYISTMLTDVARVSLMVTVASQPASTSIDAQGMFDEMQQSDTSVAIAHTAFNTFFNTEELDRWLESCDEQGESIGVNKIHVKPQFFDVGKDYNWARGIRSTEIQLADGKNCELHRCWADILDAISKAQHSTDITGWLTILVRDDSNSVDLLTKEGLLTTHDVEIAKGEQEIMNEVFPAESRSSGFGVAMDLPDIWPCYESKPSDAQGYAVKGIPNLRNTCYRSAVLQCLFMLGKLLERILTSTWLAIQGCSQIGVDGVLQLPYLLEFSPVLEELFVEASAWDVLYNVEQGDTWNVQLVRSIDGAAAFGFPETPEQAARARLVSGIKQPWPPPMAFECLDLCMASDNSTIMVSGLGASRISSSGEC